MGKKTLMGVLLALAFLVAAVVLRYWGPGSGQVISRHSEKAAPPAMDTNHNAPMDQHNHDHPDAKPHGLEQAPHSDTQPRHLDQLSEEMKQALRDRLLLHGPMKAQRRADGRLELPSQGRYTQMPVAVEMPDGTIVIKEYSHIPDTPDTDNHKPGQTSNADD